MATKKKTDPVAEIVARLMSEERFGLAQLARETGVNAATMNRWHGRGIRGTKLECVRVGMKLFSSREAVNRFLVATNRDVA